jgi:hypothetical protein
MSVEFHRYVLTYTSTDSFTYWVPVVEPFESMIADKTELELELLDMFSKSKGKFFFHGIELDKSDFQDVFSDVYNVPNIYTLNEWFELNKPKIED